MKVEKKVEDSFKPVTITLTFETEDEFEVFQYLVFKDVSVPNRLFGDHDINKGNVLSDMMGEIGRIL